MLSFVVGAGVLFVGVLIGHAVTMGSVRGGESYTTNYNDKVVHNYSVRDEDVETDETEAVGTKKPQHNE